MAGVSDTPYAPDQCGQNARQSGTAAGLPLSEKRVHKPFNRKEDGQVGSQKQHGFCVGRPANNKLTQLAELEEENRAPPEEEGGAASVGLKKNDGGSGFLLSGKENHIPVKQVNVLQRCCVWWVNI